MQETISAKMPYAAARTTRTIAHMEGVTTSQLIKDALVVYSKHRACRFQAIGSRLDAGTYTDLAEMIRGRS